MTPVKPITEGASNTTLSASGNSLPNYADCLSVFQVPTFVGMFTSTGLTWEARASQEEYVFHLTLEPALRPTHPNKYVAVVRGQAVDYDDSRPVLARRIIDTYGDDVPFYIGYVGDEPVERQATPFSVP